MVYLNTLVVAMASNEDFGEELSTPSDLERMNHICRVYKGSGEFREKFIQEVKDIRSRNRGDPDILAAFERFKVVYREEKVEEAEIQKYLANYAKYVHIIKTADKEEEVSNLLNNEITPIVLKYQDKRLATMGTSLTILALMMRNHRSRK